MKGTIGIYDNHDVAVNAAIYLKDHGFHANQLSILGLTETEVLDEQNHLIHKTPVNAASVGVGTGIAVGTTVGLLTGAGLLAIPGLGVLYGAGALVGALAGFDIGILGGGLAAVLATFGVKGDDVHKYKKFLKEGKFLVLIDGAKEDVLKAKDMLHTYGLHHHLESHE
jgi:hypothetical protein